MARKSNAEESSPHLTLGVCQLVIASLPLFVLFVYFLFSAYQRPFEERYQPEIYEIDDDVTLKEKMSNPLIPLFDMMMVMLAFQVIFTIFLFYLVIFIPRRHALIKSYLSGDQTETMLGDVIFKDGKGMCDGNRNYGTVVYGHPQSQGLIRKQTRIYLPYTRERTTIIKLMNRPYSGQPRSDLEHDMQNIVKAIRRIRQTAWFAGFWVAFLMLAPIYLLIQIHKINEYDDYESFKLARNIYIFVALLAVPLVCAVGVVLRWSYYRHWFVNKGRLESDNNDGRDDEDEPVVGVFMTEMTGQKRDGEIDVNDAYRSMGEDGQMA